MDKTAHSESRFPRRKRNRLENWDYSTPGDYFVTICTHEKRCFLSRITVGAIHELPETSVLLTEAGVCVKRVIETLPERYPGLFVDHYVIMPNHIHLLLRIENTRAIHELPLQDKQRRSLIDKAVGFLKMNSSKQIHVRQPGLTVWQRSYYDHIIRSQTDYLTIWNYIDTNPARWEKDRFYAAE